MKESKTPVKNDKHNQVQQHERKKSEDRAKSQSRAEKKLSIDYGTEANVESGNHSSNEETLKLPNGKKYHLETQS